VQEPRSSIETRVAIAVFDFFTHMSGMDGPQVAAGQFATAAVTDAGEVFSWGLNEAGQLGKGDFSSSAVEVPQRIRIDAQIISASVGYAHMLVLSDEGRVYSWGRNFYGQLGVGDHKDKPSPQLISFLQEEQIVEVHAGQYHSLAISARGDIFAWGYNREYELGVGDNMDRVLPQVRDLAPAPPLPALRILLNCRKTR
jgi:alpha-tubulin suppressor-like RCC1 family protein